jgi:hypothetical protein
MLFTRVQSWTDANSLDNVLFVKVANHLKREKMGVMNRVWA